MRNWKYVILCFNVTGGRIFPLLLLLRNMGADIPKQGLKREKNIQPTSPNLNTLGTETSVELSGVWILLYFLVQFVVFQVTNGF